MTWTFQRFLCFKYPQARSKHVANGFRIDEVEKFKAENTKVIGLLFELVDKTLFDSFENDIALQMIDNRLNEIYAIIKIDINYI